MKNKMTKAERILKAILSPRNQGRTAGEIAAAADVDHNHVYIFEKLVADGLLRRDGGKARKLELGDTRRMRGGRGVIYFPGQSLIAARKEKGKEIPMISDTELQARQAKEEASAARKVKTTKATKTTKKQTRKVKTESAPVARKSRKVRRPAKAVAAEDAIGGIDTTVVTQPTNEVTVDLSNVPPEGVQA